ncbi:MAG: CdaR family protein [Nitrospiraceae bacterium]|nr:CdaR family protein [Nitrospiraceae bacterium]
MKKLFLENTGLKISAVLISALLWFFVTSRGQSEMSLEAPIEFKSVPAGLGIAASSIKGVTVTVRGQERIMKSLKPSDVRVFVDLAKSKKGEATVFINKDDIRLPYAMTVTNIVPSAVRVRIEELITKSIRVSPVVTGSPEKGYFVRAVEIVPREVAAQGLKSEVRKTSELRTEVLDITGAKETMSQELAVDTAGANIKTEPAGVRVTVEIGRGR